MSKHERYREICAAASVGQATPEELLEFERHAEECEACRLAYFDYLNVSAQQFASANQNPTLSAQEARESLNSELFTRRFFERAEKEGIRFSQDVGHEVRQIAPVPRVVDRQTWERSFQAIAALVLLSVTAAGGYFFGRRTLSSRRPGPQQENPTAAFPAVGLDQRIAELAATNARLSAQINSLKAGLAKADDQLRGTETDLTTTSRDRARLQAERGSLEAQLKTVQDALAASQTLAANAQQEAAKQRDHAGEADATLIAVQVKIQDLTDSLNEKSAMLDQERQLLALGHDVSDLMGARNLHIVDVVDTDPRGKTRPAFGRIFFTEGKSLVFYAYDLNEAKIQKASYEYKVWARQEGGGKDVRSLGIFYSDDKSQRRWVFKCNDPKVLNEIDSVFVTLEPTDGDSSHPKGPNLMYAYLRGQPNHP